MADLVITADRVRLLDPTQRFTTNTRAGAAITRGKLVYEDPADATAKLARGNAVGTSKVSGVALNDAAVGEPLTIGHYVKLAMDGLSGLDHGDTVYLSADTAGAIADAAPSGAGNVVVPVGSVRIMTGSGNQKYITFDISQAFVPVALA